MRAIRDLYGDTTAQAVRIQYGGSVKPGNIADLMAMPEIDGALVGGASLDPDEFARDRPVPALIRRFLDHAADTLIIS